jgi:hypothetical protein
VRRALRLLAVAALLGAGFLGWARLLRGGPTGPIPGGRLRGEPAASLPADWSFARRDPYLLVESRAFTLPWSGRVWFLVHSGRPHLLLPGFFGDALVRRLAVDPRVRVELDGTVYAQRAVPVVDDGDLAALVAPVVRRQFSTEVGAPVARIAGAEQAAMWIYRLEDPAP